MIGLSKTLDVSYLFVLRFNVPVNNFSVMSGRSHRFLGIDQYSRESMCLAQGHNTVTLVGTNPRPLYSETGALPLGNRAP